MLAEGKGGAVRGEEVGLEGVMLQQGARGTVRLGKEVCVHIPGFPTAAAEEGVAGHQEKEGEMNGKTASQEARRSAPRRACRVFRASSSENKNLAWQVKPEEERNLRDSSYSPNTFSRGRL